MEVVPGRNPNSCSQNGYSLQRSQELRCSWTGAFFSSNLPGIYFSYKKRTFEFHPRQPWPPSRKGRWTSRAARPTEKRSGSWAPLQAPGKRQDLETVEFERKQPEKTSSNHMCKGGEASTTSKQSRFYQGETVPASVKRTQKLRTTEEDRLNLGVKVDRIDAPRRSPHPYGQVLSRRPHVKTGLVLP